MRRNTIHRYTITLITILGLLAAACHSGNDKGNRIIGRWHAVTIENPDMDSFFVKSQQYIDTVGKGNDAATNMQIYGVANMDSMRRVLQQQHDSARIIQQNAVTNTIFVFGKDHVAHLSFSGGIDSSKWNFDTVGNLVLSDMNPAGPATMVTMQVVSLTDSVLKLRMEENGSYSTVTFRLEGK